MNPHTLILTPDILARLDAAGFSGGDLGAWLVERVERAQDFEDDFRSVVAEECASDGRHCACVPHLRRRIAEVEGQRDDARNGANLAADRANRHHAEIRRLTTQLASAEQDINEARTMLAQVDRARNGYLIDLGEARRQNAALKRERDEFRALLDDERQRHQQTAREFGDLNQTIAGIFEDIGGYHFSPLDPDTRAEEAAAVETVEAWTHDEDGTIEAPDLAVQVRALIAAARERDHLRQQDYSRREREREAKITHAHDAIIGVVRHGTDDVGGDPKAEIREGLDRVEPDPILSALLAEVARAEELHGPLPIGAPSERLAAVLGGLEVVARLDLAAPAPTAMAVLCEEVGELGRATTPEEQREEAIQVMAVCYRLMRALS